MALKPIEAVEDLYEYLYSAMQLEHATIPPYLTALYSIHAGTNSAGVHILRAVVVEEMLHLTLSANILNAIGGKPDLTRADFVPQYPTYLPDGEQDFQVSLRRFSPEAVDTFLAIERPALPQPTLKGAIRHAELGAVMVSRQQSWRGLLPAFRSEDDSELRFYSIGEFYQAIENGLEKMCHEHGEKNVFCGNPSRQVTPEYYYSGGGELIPIYDLDSAKAAIRLISEQGEGYNGGVFDNAEEISHYYRFQQLKLGRYYVAGDSPNNPHGEPVDIDWNAVYPIKEDARLSDYPPDSELYNFAVSFNEYYQQFLAELTKAFNGQPELLLEAVPEMFRIRNLMNQLMRYPIPGQHANAAPTFEMPR